MFLTFNGQAVFYDTHEIRSETRTLELNNLSQNYNNLSMAWRKRSDSPLNADIEKDKQQKDVAD